MSTKKIYSPWIKWHGGECPVPPETMVDIKLRSGFVRGLRPAGKYIWNHDDDDDDGDIMEYCVILEQADLEKEHALVAARHIFGLKGGEL